MTRIGMLSVVVLGTMSSLAVAAPVTVLDYYPLGESDAGAVASGPGAAQTVDSSGNAAGANNLTKNGSPTYTSDVAASSASATGSTLSMNFPGGGYNAYTTGSFVTSATDNFGVEGWFKPTETLSPTSYYSLAYNGSSGNATGGYIGSGFGLYISGGTYQGLFGNIAFLDSGVTATPGVWTYFALVRDNGVNTLYINNTTAIDPGNNIAPAAATGTPFTGIGGGKDSEDAFPGEADNVRFFTLDPATFNASSDLLIAAPSRPLLHCSACSHSVRSPGAAGPE